DSSPELLSFKPRRDRATKLLNFLADVVVNGNPQAKGQLLDTPLLPIIPPKYDRKQPPPPGTRQLLLELGPKQFAKWILKQKRLLITDTTFRDAHQSLLATRVRTVDLLGPGGGAAGFVSHNLPELFSLEMWGGATFDTTLRFLQEDPWERLAHLR